MGNNKSQTTGIKVTGRNNTFINIGVDGFDKGIVLGETAEGNKFKDVDVITSPPVSHQQNKKWYEKPFGIVFLLVIAGLIVGFLVYYFGWT